VLEASGDRFAGFLRPELAIQHRVVREQQHRAAGDIRVLTLRLYAQGFLKMWTHHRLSLRDYHEQKLLLFERFLWPSLQSIEGIPMYYLELAEFLPQ
jgi:hypothetical protein